MPGVTGREVKAAYARCNTWGVPASVTQQVLLSSNDGLDPQWQVVDDEAFSQDFIGSGEVGDHQSVQQELQLIGRFTEMDSWFAASMGGASTPVVVSSVAANSLVAYQHNIVLTSELSHNYTLALTEDVLVREVPSMRVRGFTLRVGDMGRLLVSFPIVGSKVVFNSTVNTNSTVQVARAATIGNRMFRKSTRFRLNNQSAGALGATDEITIAREFVFAYSRPVATDDFVLNQDYIIEPDDDGFAEMSLEITYARMNTVSANSLVTAFPNGASFKGDIFVQGPFINSTTRMSMLIEMPNLQVYGWRGNVTGQSQVRPVCTFRLKSASAAPTGMTGLTLPFRMTLINTNSAALP